MKPVDEKTTTTTTTNTYIDASKWINDKDPKFKIDTTARVSKCKIIFGKV